MTAEISLDSRDPDFSVQISPEPTDDERDALIAALTILLTEPTVALGNTQLALTNSRWARAGRRAAFDARRIHPGRWDRRL